MQCRNCGANISDNANFCDKCGMKSVETENTISPISITNSGITKETFENTPKKSSPQLNRSDTVFCPKCRSKNLQVIVENNTKGGGFGAGKSCVGYLLLGPLGLLCGACGSDVKTISKTYFTCMDCGNKFREVTDIVTEISQEMKYSIISAVVTGFLGIGSLNTGIFPLAVICLICMAGSIYGYFESKKVRTEIEARGYNAEWYKSNKTQ